MLFGLLTRGFVLIIWPISSKNCVVFFPPWCMFCFCPRFVRESVSSSLFCQDNNSMSKRVWIRKITITKWCLVGDSLFLLYSQWEGKWFYDSSSNAVLMFVSLKRRDWSNNSTLALWDHWFAFSDMFLCHITRDSIKDGFTSFQLEFNHSGRHWSDTSHFSLKVWVEEDAILPFSSTVLVWFGESIPDWQRSAEESAKETYVVYLHRSVRDWLICCSICTCEDGKVQLLL